MQPEKGERYLHYKGKLYVVLGMAMHSETDEDMVTIAPISLEDCPNAPQAPHHMV